MVLNMLPYQFQLLLLITKVNTIMVIEAIERRTCQYAIGGWNGCTEQAPAGCQRPLQPPYESYSYAFSWD